MSSILSTQNRQTFLRRKYCFLPPKALSPPVGRIDPLIGLPPLCSGMAYSFPPSAGGLAAGAAGGVAGAAGAVAVGAPGAGCAGAAPGAPGAACSGAAGDGAD